MKRELSVLPSDLPKDIVLRLDKLGVLKNSCLYPGYVLGYLDITAGGTGFIKPLNKGFKKDLLVEARFLNNARFKDLVLARYSKKRAKIIAIISPSSKYYIVLTKQYKKQILGMDIKYKNARTLKASQASLRALGLDKLLKVTKDGEILEVLGDINDPRVDEKLSLAIFSKEEEFSKASLLQARAYERSVDASFYPSRRDLRELAFCTIDPKDAKDHDDAIYYDSDKKELFVAIADVSEYVSPFSPLDEEAKKRAFSIYFPDKVVPMLPFELSANICSLKPGKDRLAYVFKLSFSGDFKLIKDELFKALICSKKNFTYEEVDSLLGSDLKEFAYLNPLNTLCKNIREKRLLDTLEFSNDELKMQLDENSLLQSTQITSDTPAHKLVEECMLLANTCAALRLEAGVFRNHAKPDASKLALLFEKLVSLGLEIKSDKNFQNELKSAQKSATKLGLKSEVDKLIIKAQKRAIYEPQAHGHYALGFLKYSHFTSPIRRYADLYLHRLLKAMGGKNQAFLEENLSSLCTSLSVKEREAAKVEADFKARKFARFAKARQGSVFEAFVLEDGVRLLGLVAGAKIEADTRGFELFEKVRVRICDVNLLDAKIVGKVLNKVD